MAATIGLAGYVAFFQNVKHPSSNSSITDKNTEIPGKDKEKEGKGTILVLLAVIPARFYSDCHSHFSRAEYAENQPTRKLMHAAGKKEGDANIFPSKQTCMHCMAVTLHFVTCTESSAIFADKEAGQKMSESKNK